MKGKSICWH